MDGKFIYVFDAETKEYLEKHGFTLLKTNEDLSIYIFANDSQALSFDLVGVSYITSDVLTF